MNSKTHLYFWTFWSESHSKDLLQPLSSFLIDNSRYNDYEVVPGLIYNNTSSFISLLYVLLII